MSVILHKDFRADKSRKPFSVPSKISYIFERRYLSGQVAALPLFTLWRVYVAKSIFNRGANLR